MARELKERLIEVEKEGRPLRVYCGFDPRTSYFASRTYRSDE